MLSFVIVTPHPLLRAPEVVRFPDAYYGNGDSGNMRGSLLLPRLRRGACLTRMCVCKQIKPELIYVSPLVFLPIATVLQVTFSICANINIRPLDHLVDHLSVLISMAFVLVP